MLGPWAQTLDQGLLKETYRCRTDKTHFSPGQSVAICFIGFAAEENLFSLPLSY